MIKIIKNANYFKACLLNLIPDSLDTHKNRHSRVWPGKLSGILIFFAVWILNLFEICL